MLAIVVGEDGAINVDFSIELEDIVAFNIYHYTRSALGRRQFYRRWLLIGISVVLALAGVCYLFSVRGLLPSLSPALIISVVAAVAYVGAYPWIYAWRLRRSSEAVIQGGRNLAVFGPRRMTLTSQFVMHSSPFTQSAVRWIAVEKVDPQAVALYIYVSSNAAHIIPRRAFASDDDFQTFVHTAQEFHSRNMSADNPLRTQS